MTDNFKPLTDEIASLVAEANKDLAANARVLRALKSGLERSSLRVSGDSSMPLKERARTCESLSSLYEAIEEAFKPDPSQQIKKALPRLRGR